MTRFQADIDRMCKLMEDNQADTGAVFRKITNDGELCQFSDIHRMSLFHDTKHPCKGIILGGKRARQLLDRIALVTGKTDLRTERYGLLYWVFADHGWQSGIQLIVAILIAAFTDVWNQGRHVLSLRDKAIISGGLIGAGKGVRNMVTTGSLWDLLGEGSTSETARAKALISRGLRLGCSRDHIAGVIGNSRQTIVEGLGNNGRIILRRVIRGPFLEQLYGDVNDQRKIFDGDLATIPKSEGDKKIWSEVIEIAGQNFVEARMERPETGNATTSHGFKEGVLDCFEPNRMFVDLSAGQPWGLNLDKNQRNRPSEVGELWTAGNYDQDTLTTRIYKRVMTELWRQWNETEVANDNHV